MSGHINTIDFAFLERTLDSMDAMIFVKDAALRFIYANAAFQAQCPVDSVIGLRVEDYETPELAEKFTAWDREILSTNTAMVQEGETAPDTWGVVKISPLPLSDGTTGLLGVVFDISEFRNLKIEVEALRRTEVLALHDPLTGLPNRRHLETRFAELGSDFASEWVLMHLDLDGFKAINDNNGHAAGDAVLVEVSRRMTSALEPEMFAARIGGDEFVILAPFGQIEDARTWAKRLLKLVRTPIKYAQKRLSVGTSCGIVKGDTVAFELDPLLHAADVALYRAKENGRNRVETFSPALGAQLVEEKRQKEKVLKGLERREFFPQYQPQIDLHTGEIVGLEALARWRHPELGLVPPAEFVPVFEAHGRLDDLDLMILDAVLDDARHLKAAGLNPLRISVNMSTTLLSRADMCDLFRSRAPFDFTLAIELSETVSFETLDTATRLRLDSLREMGCEIEVDDFGSAKASVLGVISIQPNRLKIDKGLILPMLETSSAVQIASAILQIAKAMDIPVIAEGVETRAHAEELVRMGCQIGQGYHFAPPLPMTDLLNFMRKRA